MKWLLRSLLFLAVAACSSSDGDHSQKAQEINIDDTEDISQGDLGSGQKECYYHQCASSDCIDAWEEASSKFRSTTIKDQFYKKCINSKIVVMCKNNYIEFQRESMCSKHGGVKYEIKFPDG